MDSGHRQSCENRGNPGERRRQLPGRPFAGNVCSWSNQALFCGGESRVGVVGNPSLRALRMWLLLALALPESCPDRAFLIDLAATAFAEGWRAELDAAVVPQRTSVGVSLEA